MMSFNKQIVTLVLFLVGTFVAINEVKKAQNDSIKASAQYLECSIQNIKLLQEYGGSYIKGCEDAVMSMCNRYVDCDRISIDELINKCYME